MHAPDLSDLPQLRRLLKTTTGLDLPADMLERAMRERLRTTGGGAHCAYAPRPGTPEFDALVELVVVPESWMMRIQSAFDAALVFVRERLQDRPGRQVRILSLPCAAGEEPYSMALTLAAAGITPAQCRIDALDLSHAAIARARAGRYVRNAFRGTAPGFAERHFTREGDEYLIGDAPRQYVEFRQANLFALDTGHLPGRYDVIFCRNLMIYFDGPTQAAAAAHLHAMLADDGMLLSGFAEVPSFCRHGFTQRPTRDAFSLCKHSPAMVTAQLMPPPAPLRGAAGMHAVTPRAIAPISRQAVAPPVRPAAPTPHAMLIEARRHADAGQLDRAGQLCREALAQLPDSADAWYLLGLVSDCAGQPAAAARHWRSCVYLDPEHYDALCALALLHERRGDAGPAANYRRRAAHAFASPGSDDA